MSLFVGPEARLSRGSIPVHRVHLTIFRSIPEISSRGTGRLRRGKHRPAGVRGVRGGPNVVAASRRMRPAASDPRTFGDHEGGGSPPGNVREISENALSPGGGSSEERDDRAPKRRRTSSKCRRARTPPLFFNFFPSSTSEWVKHARRWTGSGIWATPNRCGRSMEIKHQWVRGRIPHDAIHGVSDLLVIENGVRKRKSDYYRCGTFFTGYH